MIIHINDEFTHWPDVVEWLQTNVGELTNSQVMPDYRVQGLYEWTGNGWVLEMWPASYKIVVDDPKLGMLCALRWSR